MRYAWAVTFGWFAVAAAMLYGLLPMKRARACFIALIISTAIIGF